MSVATQFRERIYGFRAERRSPSQGSVGVRAILLPDAANLPEVLQNLQANLRRFQRFNRTVREVLPQVEQISVRNADNQQAEILVWVEGAATERQALAVPLGESGTGIGQVLAIL